MDKLGAHFFWGYSSALDLLPSSRCGVVEVGDDGGDVGKEVWTLQACAGDCRHVLRTLSSLFEDGSCHEGTVVGFTIYEKEVELLARQMLLLLVILDTEVDLKERVELFLEVHGNLELTEKAEAAVDAYARRLEDWITSLKPSDSAALLRYFDVSDLKYQEKDELLRVFKSWRKTKQVNAQALWDYRVRKFYGERYDFRKNLIDWDYHMRMSGKKEGEDANVLKSSKSIVHHVHFRRWRVAGMAHEFRDKKYNVPNRTLMSTIASRLVQYKDRNLDAKGASVSAYGYFGDIQNAPYSSFGLEAWKESDQSRLFNKINKQYEHTAVDVSRANLEHFGKTLSQRVNSAENKVCLCALDASAGDKVQVRMTAVEQHETIGEVMGRVKLRFATGEKVVAKSKRGEAITYDAVVIGCRSAHVIKDATHPATSAPGTVLYVESCDNMVEVTKEHASSFGSKVSEIAREEQWGQAETSLGKKGYYVFEKVVN